MNTQTYEANPGFQLREFLSRRFPRPERPATFSNMDSVLNANGEFVSLLHDSALDYMTRRLVTGAAYVRRQSDWDGVHEEEFNRRLRSFLRGAFDFSHKDVEIIFTLLKDCLIARNRTPSAHTKTLVKRGAERAGIPRCYMCGREVTFQSQGADDSGEVEHLWPRDMGGLSDEENLGIACHKCNHHKESRIGHADFHYEAICLTTDSEDDHFQAEFRYEYRLAVWARNANSCSVCGKQPSHVGALNFARVDDSDTWHFLNIGTVCAIHKER